MTHDEVRDLAPQYVLGDLDVVTRAHVSEHLKTCAACREEVRAHAHTLDALARSVPQEAPPPALRARIMKIPRGTRREFGGRSKAISPAWLTAIAASLVAALGLYQAWSNGQELSQLRTEVATLRESALALEASRTALQRQTDEGDKSAAVLRAHDVVRFDLAGLGPAPGARARAFVKPGDAMVLSAEGLPALQANTVYQLWAIIGSKPISIGTFAPDAQGHAHGVMPLPAGVTGRPDLVAVTVEPAPGVPAPTGEMYLKSAN